MAIIRNVTMQDLQDIVKVEESCFLPEEVASKETFEKRISSIPDTFFVAIEAGQVVGFINGSVLDKVFITDDLFKELKPNPSKRGHQSVLGLAVSPAFQNKGLATELLNVLEKEARVHMRKTMTLTCKENLIPF